MKFTAWQIDKLIRGLHAYRVMKAVNGQVPSWKVVMDDLLMTPVTAHKYTADGKEPTFREEALRRFAAGLQTLEAVKLEDVRRFLVHKRVFSEAELLDDRDLMAEGAFLQARLGVTSEEAVKCLAALASCYRATRPALDATEQVELVFLREPLGTLLAVEERIELIRTGGDELLYEKADRYRASQRLWKGYAFMTSRIPTLHVFLRGGSPEELVHYVRVGTSGMQKLDLLLLVRSGEEVPDLTAGEDRDRMLARYNVIRFSPVQTKGTPHAGLETKRKVLKVHA